jgi:hypothetical protein
MLAGTQFIRDPPRRPLRVPWGRDKNERAANSNESLAREIQRRVKAIIASKVAGNSFVGVPASNSGSTPSGIIISYQLPRLSFIGSPWLVLHEVERCALTDIVVRYLNALKERQADMVYCRTNVR